MIENANVGVPPRTGAGHQEAGRLVAGVDGCGGRWENPRRCWPHGLWGWPHGRWVRAARLMGLATRALEKMPA